MNLVTKAEAKRLILALGRAKPDGFTEAEAVELVEAYEMHKVATAMLALAIQGELGVRWDGVRKDFAFSAPPKR